MIGVFSFLYSADGPAAVSGFHVHATDNRDTLSRVIWSSGENRVLARSR